jgi:hypothetical protein
LEEVRSSEYALEKDNRMLGILVSSIFLPSSHEVSSSYPIATAMMYTTDPNNRAQ